MKIPTLISEGVHSALIQTIDPPEQGHKCFFIRAHIRLEGQDRIWFISGFLEGLILIYDLREQLEGKIMVFRVKHRFIESSGTIETFSRIQESRK